MAKLDLSYVLNDASNRLDAFRNPAIQLILDDLKSSQWPDIKSVVRQLSMASCASGSWSGCIYYHDLRKKLADDDWQDAINNAIENYKDSTGELPKFSQIEDMVTFTVDDAAFQVLCYLESLDQVYVVSCYADSLDTNPDCVAFTTEWEAEDFMSEEVERRVSYRVEHSPYSVSETDFAEWEEQESQLIKLSFERTL